MTEISNNEIGSSVRAKLNTALNKLDSVTVDGSGNLTVSPGLKIGEGQTITTILDTYTDNRTDAVMTQRAAKDYANGDASLFRSEGWNRLPSGLMMQWGNTSFTADEDIPFTVNFPLTFTQLFNLQTTLQIDSGAGMDAFDIYIRSISSGSNDTNATGFTAQVSSQQSTNFGTATCRWFAIGIAPAP